MSPIRSPLLDGQHGEGSSVEVAKARRCYEAWQHIFEIGRFRSESPLHILGTESQYIGLGCPLS